jgi:hypothetical protein
MAKKSYGSLLHILPSSFSCAVPFGPIHLFSLKRWMIPKHTSGLFMHLLSLLWTLEPISLFCKGGAQTSQETIHPIDG